LPSAWRCSRAGYGSARRPISGPILVTGAAGFVGRHLLELLRGDAVALDADVRDGDALAKAVREARPRAVVHLAAVSSVGDSWAEPAEAWHVNAVGTVNLLAAVAAERPQARILVTSTGEVYGRAEQLPTTEEAAAAPVSPYAASKAAAEIAAGQSARARGLDVVVPRAFQHEGPGRDERFAVGSWTRQLAELERTGGGTLRVGDLGARRDITDVRDVCTAYAALLDPAVPAGVYNVASGQAVSMQEVLDMLVSLVSVPVSVEPDATRMRPAELPVVWGDASKLRAATGWEPRIPLRQTLEDALDAARLAATTDTIGTR
jgi:GDP-4-dehydro-6-deoxy-D-mannose reductase